MKRIMLVIVFGVLTLLVACETITPSVTETVTITYETNGGTLGSDATLEVDKGTAISEPTVTKEGHTLLGWYSDSTFNVAYDFAQGVQGNITIYAKWQPLELVVTYYTDAEYDTIITSYGESFPTTDDPVVEGYHFDGWYSDQELTTPFEFTSAVVTDNTTLYGKFTIEEYTLTIINMGNIVSETTYTYGELVDIPTDFTMEGYIFNGVYEEEQFINQVISNFAMPADNVTLYIEMEEFSQVLTIYLVPFRPGEELLDISEDLKTLMLAALEDAGSSYTDIEFYVGSTYETVGEALLVGIADVAYLPATTYVMYHDVESSPIEPLVALTRIGLNKDYDDANLWNDGMPTTSDSQVQVPYYRSLIIAGPSAAGQAVAAKVNSGAPLVWDDVKDLNWCVRSVTSSSGYVYPNMWLNTKFGKTYDDITGYVTTTAGYGNSMSSLAAEICDVATFYADARRDYADEWETDYGKTDIWTETNVIGVSAPIMNDVIAYNADNLDTTIIEILEEFFVTLGDDPMYWQLSGLFYNDGFILIDDTDYDPVREALEFYGY
ncbi:InlB B-repeat-containing protein [Candidatus Xianfuyuplasma coldseepsis]|uniref:PhnD/SsuA/transferrin family substrate-binding protein n=1 Tax=Candidatus Xianfuyuplasma coldseepsis TaxID=2782163 RepID=A0A7L7KR45_9MOLU|nr:InlB B-repeat-containing protein [Xianfuyuplasma coldseepsis]QMS85157.1 PhnD/SsuA/transferrin family substrate-binding protein [Xianfuyuplasma coldseepsis]